MLLMYVHVYAIAYSCWYAILLESKNIQNVYFKVNTRNKSNNKTYMCSYHGNFITHVNINLFIHLLNFFMKRLLLEK